MAHTDENSGRIRRYNKGDSDSNSEGGGKTKLTPAVHDAIIASVRNGNYLGTAAFAAGISRSAVSGWKRKAESGIQPYAGLFDDLENVSALAEAESVAEIRANPDWRAKAWWLERGPSREAWRADAGSTAADAVVGLLDALRSRASEALPAADDVVVHDAHTAEDEQPPS